MTSDARRIAVAVALGAVGLALAALAWPRAAITLIGVLVAVVLAGLALEATRRVARDVPRPDRSPFIEHATIEPPQLPQELRILTLQTDDLRRSRTVTSSLEWRVKRVAIRRLFRRHGLDQRRADHQQAIADTVSPRLHRILTSDYENTGLPAAAFSDLLDELESL